MSTSSAVVRLLTTVTTRRRPRRGTASSTADFKLSLNAGFPAYSVFTPRWLVGELLFRAYVYTAAPAAPRWVACSPSAWGIASGAERACAFDPNPPSRDHLRWRARNPPRRAGDMAPRSLLPFLERPVLPGRRSG